MLNNYADVIIYSTTEFYNNAQISEIRLLKVNYNNINLNDNEIRVCVIEVSIKGNLK